MREDRPSATALTIAVSLLYLGRRKPQLVPPGQTAILEAGIGRLGAVPALLSRLARGPLGALGAAALESAVVPGIIEHYALRKREIERRVRGAFAEGFTRLVVLAGGFDLLAARLAREGRRTLELDHPATQELKRAMLGEGEGPAFVAADLSKTMPSAVLDLREPTVFVVEGLTMYLTERQLRALWADLARAPRARLLCTFMEPGPDGRARFPRQTGLLDRFLAHSHERFQWGAPLAEIPALLKECGWAPREVLGRDTFPVGEYLLSADRG